MALRFTVLASGSKGNCSLIEADSFGLLLDAGLGPRQLKTRLAAVGGSLQSVGAVLLTHLHTDHWNDRIFLDFLRRGITIYCHGEHLHHLRNYSASFRDLLEARLVGTYEADQELKLPSGVRCQPLLLRHDGGPTFGFRIERVSEKYSQVYSLGYVADLGCWDRSLAEALAEVDLLALEFNHDVALEYASGRQPRLIARVLGDEGHLSNVQAAALLKKVLELTTPGRLRHVIQLHLSRDCNRPELAAAAALEVLAKVDSAPEVHTAHQDYPLPTLHLGTANSSTRPSSRPSRPSKPQPHSPSVQRWLPGLEME